MIVSGLMDMDGQIVVTNASSGSQSHSFRNRIMISRGTTISGQAGVEQDGHQTIIGMGIGGMMSLGRQASSQNSSSKRTNLQRRPQAPRTNPQRANPNQLRKQGLHQLKTKSRDSCRVLAIGRLLTARRLPGMPLQNGTCCVKRLRVHENIV